MGQRLLSRLSSSNDRYMSRFEEGLPTELLLKTHMFFYF